MPDEELTLILRLRDEATKQMKSARAGIVAAGAAIAAAGFTAGKKWDDATKTIVAGTGATGDALKGLQSDYQAVAKYGDGAATVIADLNTHLGLEGEALRMVAEAALKAKVDTNLFGDVASQLGLDAEGAAGFLDQLTVASQGTGVDIDVLTRTIGRSGARWQEAGGDMEGLAATVVEAAYEFGPSGLRGRMSEILQEVDKGVIPAISDLNDIVGESTGAVESTYKAGKTWRDTLREMKAGALAYLGPGGDMVGAIGSAASGLALAGPQMLKWIKGLKLSTVAQRAFNLAMKLNPIGLIVTAVTLVGLAIYTWRDQIFGFLRGAWTSFVSGLEKGYNFIARIVPGMEEVSFATKMQFEPAVEAAAVAVEHLAVEAEPVPSILDSLAVAAEEAEEAVDTFTGTVEDSSAALGHWGLDISKIGTQVDLIEPPLHDLTGTVEGQSAALDNWGLDIENIGTQVDLIPPKLGAVSQALGTFTTNLQTTFSAENVGGTIARAFEAGGSLMDAMKSIGAQMATNLGSFFSSTLSSIPIVGPFLAQFGGLMVAGLVKLGGKLWSSIKSLFGGPDEAEQAAREMFGGFHAGAVEALGGTQRYADEVQVAINDGWDRTLAESRAGFILWGTDAGKTYDAAFADYERYQNAVKAGNTELMEQIEADYAAYRAASADTTEAVVHDAAEIGEQFKGLTVDEAAKLGAALLDLGRKANRGFTAIHDSAIATGNALADRLLPQINAVSRAIRDIPRNVTIRQRYVTVGGLPRRQHGGPVGAGQSVIVGEAGPEIFTPGRSGSVASNKSIPTAEEIGAAVAAALHRVPLVVPQDAVTDSILRRSPNRQALRGWA